MYRVRSTDLWFNAPGIVAAYQPVAAPGPLLARYNVGNNARMAGKYTAVPGVAPTWSGAVGWGFSVTGSTNLTTDIVPAAGWSSLARFSGVANTGYLYGVYSGSDTRHYIRPDTTGDQLRYGNGGVQLISPRHLSGVLGVAGQQGYRDGVADGAAISAWSGTGTQAILLGVMNDNGTPQLFITANMQAWAAYARPLSAVEMWHVSRQMAYCHVNPDWSAWGRRRQYFYAPAQAAAAFQSAWAARANSIQQVL